MRFFILVLLVMFPSIALAKKPEDPVARIMATAIMTLIVAGISWFIFFLKNKKEKEGFENGQSQKKRASKIGQFGWKVGITGAILGGVLGIVITQSLGQGIIYAIGGFSLLGAPFFIFEDSHSLIERIIAVLFFGGVLIALLLSVAEKWSLK